MVNVARLVPHVSWVEELGSDGQPTGVRGLVVAVDVANEVFNIRLSLSPPKIRVRCRQDQYVEIHPVRQ
jgi:hypothetical protein